VATTTSMTSRKIRVPHGEAGTHNGWFTFVRGEMITRREALRVLIFGPRLAKIETTQSDDKHTWGF
jgi:hypothetical protein